MITRRYLTVIVLLCNILLNACGTTKQVHPDKINHLLILPFVVEISEINKGSRLENSPVLSRAVNIEILQEVRALVPPSIQTTVLESDDLQYEKISAAVITMIRSVEGKQHRLENVNVPDKLMQVLDSAGQDHALCVFNKGFTRTDANFSKRLRLNTGVNIFSLGHLNFPPAKSYSNMVALVIERKSKTIRYYQKNLWIQRDPSETLSRRTQVRHLFMRYAQFRN
jgi:hypothetical protein